LFNSSFFRQSAWMLFATVASSGFLVLVQGVALRMPKEPVNEYGAFAALLDVLAQASLPITGVLTIFMRQTVAAHTEELRRQLVRAARGIVGSMFVLWVALAVIATLFQSHLLQNLKLPNAIAWWLTLFAALAALIAPVLTGILQGEQKFFWVGSASILNGIGRFAGVLVAVVSLHKGATGAMAGVLAGNLITLVWVAWPTRWIWTAPSLPVPWRLWLKEIIPLTLGVAAPTYVFTQDMIVVQSFYEPGASSVYGGARVVGRTLFFLTAPMTAVMFPKIVKSAVASERTNVLAQAVGATALIGTVAALCSTLMPDLMLRVLFLLSGRSDYAQTAWLIPWFAWALLPLALSNLLVNNLLARNRFEAVPWLVAVAAGYGITLRFTYWSYLTVILTLGFFSLLLFGVCLVFTIRQPRTALRG
jgi:O-antigen/teichoic acid export membrane protein